MKLLADRQLDSNVCGPIFAHFLPYKRDWQRFPFIDSPNGHSIMIGHAKTVTVWVSFNDLHYN